jgi:biotin carboxyl carrier protein
MAGEVIVLRDEAGREHRVQRGPDGTITIGGQSWTAAEAGDGSLTLAGARTRRAWAVESGGTRWVFLDGQVFTFETARSGRRKAASQHGLLMSPMPATVRKVLVAAGDTVATGDVLLLLEAMKMELPIRATSNGRVAAVTCAEGDLVQPGVSLIDIDIEGET